ncbi:UNVERIFIED_CONTAM: hypothetical protein Sradi_4117000 [Sesamum radiatum]|uniref:Uncharacterized protein n=1 Tax=Sesamum radiatum TaxID=300843 RepID=A0AAW2P2A5_SESRA
MLPEGMKVVVLIRVAQERDVELVRAEFCLWDADCILDIDLLGNGEGNNLVWHFERYGKFSIRSAYRVASYLRERQHAPMLTDHGALFRAVRPHLRSSYLLGGAHLKHYQPPCD